MNKKIISLSVAIFLATPLVGLAFAPGAVPGSLNLSINGLIDLIFGFLWPIVLAFTMIMFVIAGLQFFAAQGDPSKVGDARQFVIWGVVGMVVTLLAWSFPIVIRLSFGV